MTIVSVNISLPGVRRSGDRKVRTGGRKTPVPSAVLRLDSFEGDGQADRVRHGGRDRSACVYPADHYRFWISEGLSLNPGDFCENLTVEGALEDRIHIGDIFTIGGARVQLSVPRDPCGKIDLVSGVPSLFKRAIANGGCGFHMRTLEEGLVRQGDEMILEERNPAGVTVVAVHWMAGGVGGKGRLSGAAASQSDGLDQGSGGGGRRSIQGGGIYAWRRALAVLPP